MAVLGRSRSGPPPPDQILDPPLHNNPGAICSCQDWASNRESLTYSSTGRYFVLISFLFQINPNTPRFNLISGNVDEAQATLERMAKINNVKLPEGKLVSNTPISVRSPFCRLALVIGSLTNYNG